ncbi:MAG: hypothetical protein IT364_16605 [Candidatus Hydrogenedentes bacterium]|nr:hypothetical protein [Candidatus Hydrogenedentota bacterium]
MAKYSKARVQQAIDASVKKWLDIATGHGVDKGAENCPLCALFFHRGEGCEGCPVQKKTNKKGCRGTPYYDFTDAYYTEFADLVGTFHRTYLDPMAVIGPQSQQAALDEALFLSRLKP